jgi:diacylglycerol kinase (ATP)
MKTDADKPVVIVNRRAGGGLSDAGWARLSTAVADGLGPFSVVFTEHRGHATELARAASAAGAPLVVAFGGDGTINEVANGLLGTGTPLGIIPRGTGGDFRRTLGLPEDVTKAAAWVKQATPRTIDAGVVKLCDHDGTPIERRFVNVSSVGFSAAVADRANRSSKRLGAKAAFLSATLRTLFGTDNADVVLRIDDQEPMRRKAMFVAMGNGCYFGGGMKVCPKADLQSGTLDLVVVGDLSRLDVILKTNRLYDGTHLNMKEVFHTTARKVHIESADPGQKVLVELDGETPGQLPATFDILPGALVLQA